MWMLIAGSAACGMSGGKIQKSVVEDAQCAIAAHATAAPACAASTPPSPRPHLRHERPDLLLGCAQRCLLVHHAVDHLGTSK